MFTRLQPGPATLEISAPSYVAQTIPVTLKRGANRLAEPVELVGYEIPDLVQWIIFENHAGNDIVQELRPVSSAGPAVINHPAMDLWIGARISVQVKDGVPVREETDTGAARGEELFEASCSGSGTRRRRPPFATAPPSPAPRSRPAPPPTG